MSVDTAGGRAIPQSVTFGFAELVGESLMRGHRLQVAAGWVNHYRPQTAIEVIRERLEIARSVDPDTPEGFYEHERFGARCEERW